MDDQPDGIESEEPPCPICGERDFTFGRLDFPIVFLGDGESWWKQMFYRLSGRRTKARKCNRCDNVQMFDKKPAADRRFM